jgi:hypothetical protein
MFGIYYQLKIMERRERSYHWRRRAKVKLPWYAPTKRADRQQTWFRQLFARTFFFNESISHRI